MGLSFPDAGEVRNARCDFIDREREEGRGRLRGIARTEWLAFPNAGEWQISISWICQKAVEEWSMTE